MKKNTKRILAAALTAVTVVSMTACGKGDAAQTDADKENQAGGQTDGKEFVYVPEYVSFGKDGDSETSRYNFTFANGKIYYNMFTESEAGGYTGMYVYDTTTGTEAEIVSGDMSDNSWWQSMTVDASDNQYIVWSEWVVDEGNPDNSYNRYTLAKYDAAGNTVYSADLTDVLAEDEENSYIQSVLVDGQGRAYLQSGQVVFLMDAQGSLKGKVSTGDSWINSMTLGGDGTVYVAYYDWSSTADGGYLAAGIDFDGVTLKEAFELPMSGATLSTGITKELLLSDETALYEFDKKSGEKELLLEWLDSDINGNYIEAVHALEDGRIMVIINSWDTGKTEIAYLNKTPASEVVQKTELTVAVLYSSQELSTAAVDFNKSSDKYRVKIKTYYDFDSGMDYNDAVSAMNNDIVSGSSCPDIIAIDSDMLSPETLLQKGILEDLTPYLEKSTVLNREDLVESVLESYTYDGKLAAIPKSFGIATIAGKTSVVGEKAGWTIADVMKLAEQYPDAELFEYASRSEMMYLLMMLNQDEFIDWESGNCDFNNDLFRQMLTFVAGFPEELEWNEDQESTPVRLGNGSLLLYMDNISSIMDLQVTAAMFGEPVTYVGYPSDGEESGSFMNVSGCYGIAARSENKDGAWAFIENYLNSESTMFSYGFSIKKAVIEEDIAEAMKVEYVLDENGDPLLDENGAPVIQSSGGFGYDDWEYDYRPATEEERELLWELIGMASPLPSQSNSEILNIITEEADAFYKGQKSVDEVAAQIQSRVSMYVSENS